jgi:hypothetical protein
MITKLSVGLLTCLTHYVDQAEQFPQCTVTGDGMWVYLTTSETKTAFMTWEHPYLPIK